jgi:hypothetical protein
MSTGDPSKEGVQMPDIPELRQENELMDMLINVLEENKAQTAISFGDIVGDWKKSFVDNKLVNTLILESDPEQLRTDLNQETALLDAFLAELEKSPAPESALAEQLRERWNDLFTREKARNQEIIDVIGG